MYYIYMAVSHTTAMMVWTIYMAVSRTTAGLYIYIYGCVSHNCYVKMVWTIYMAVSHTTAMLRWYVLYICLCLTQLLDYIYIYIYIYGCVSHNCYVKMVWTIYMAVSHTTAMLRWYVLYIWLCLTQLL